MKKYRRNWPSIGISSWMSTGFASIYRVTLAGSRSVPERRRPEGFGDLMLRMLGAYVAPMPDIKAILAAKLAARAWESPSIKALVCSKSKLIRSCAILRRSWL